LALAGAAVLTLGGGGRQDSARAPARTPFAEQTTSSGTQAAKGPPREMPRPVHIAIPAIDVSARIVPLGLNSDRTLEVPTNLADTGWFTEGPEPGERGAAVVVGHVASLSGPGVFYRLRDLHPGDVIRIRLRDGEVASYRARSAIVVPKSAFPTKRVYAQTPGPTLRLITCSGTPDASTGQHPDNRIVFASLIGVA
jgi:LPXTG-site transpeptidase (sortase) family protein